MKHLRKKLRLHEFDYTTPGMYFVTTCTHHRLPLLSRLEPLGDKIICRLSAYGQIAEECLVGLQAQFPNVETDTYIVMPDHIHVIIAIRPTTYRQFSLSQIIGTFKTMSAKRIRLAGADCFRWQRSFHDRVIRNEQELTAIRKYIALNPLQWWLKCKYGKSGSYE